MIWLIIVLVIGVIGVIAYRFYFYPPLSPTAKQQQQKYIQAFQEAKKLVYQMTDSELALFRQVLQQNFFDAGRGCFYGPQLMIHLVAEASQVVIQVFSDSPQDLTRAMWKVLKCKPQAGGMENAAPDG